MQEHENAPVDGAAHADVDDSGGGGRSATADPAMPPPQPLQPRPHPPGSFRTLGKWLAEDARDTAIGLRERMRFRRRRLPAWNAEQPRNRDPGLVTAWHVLRRTASSESWIDDRTWQDLHLDEVFDDIDRCTSPIGAQYLYDMLRSPAVADATLRERDAAAERMAEAPRLREAIREALAPLDTLDAWFLPNLLRDDLPPRPIYWYLFPALTAAAIGLLVLLFFRPVQGLMGLSVIAAINLTIQYRYHSRISPFARPLTLLGRVLASARAVGAMEDEVVGATLERLRETAGRVRNLARAARYIAIERRYDDLLGAAYTYVNTLLLLDVNAFVFSVESVARHRADLQSIFEGLGSLDAAISVAAWRTRGPWCRPSFLPRGRKLGVSELVHPLLEDAVGNDLATEGRSLLITGSNMAGKTTFIRAVAVNTVLAQTVFTCRAAGYRAPRLQIRSMIGRGDDLQRGQSYFAVELELALRLVRAAAGPAQHLFVIDEIFRGTNTTERVAAAKAVLQRLAAGDHIVVAATHDLELLPLLDEQWEFHHFRESVEAGALEFDYRIRPGPTSTHNAIRMMEAYGFPRDLVADARATAARLDQRWSGAMSVRRGEPPVA